MKLLAAGVLVLARMVAGADAPLHAGDLFPPFSGQTLTNKALELPAAGKASVIVFTFSRAAGKDARLWNERLTKDFPAALVYEAIELESAPRLVRGMALAGIRSGIPPAMQDRAIVLYQDEALWKRRLTVSDANRAYIAVVGADGRLRWSNISAFADPEYARLKQELETLLAQHH